MASSKASQNPKKRPATSQDGPATKKTKVQRSKKFMEIQQSSSTHPTKVQGKRDEADRYLKGKRRALPVTQIHEDDIPEAEENSASEVDEPVEDDMEADDQVELESAKDSRANHESHVAQRALLASRRAAKPHAARLAKAKHIWTQARQKDRERRNEGTGNSGDSKAQRNAYVMQLMELIRGHVQELVLKHDASRIIQTIVKYGTAAQRLEVAKELTGQYLQLVQGKYSKFLVSKLIRYSAAARPLILLELVHEVPRLLHHAFASPVLADAYELYCTGPERMQLLRAFWGREASIFGDGVSADLPTGGRDVQALPASHNEDFSKVTQPAPSPGGLKAVLTSSSDIERRKRTLTSVRENLLGMFNNQSPTAARHAITHRVLWEYLEALGSKELLDTDALSAQERERAWREVYESCQELLAEMIHTREGSRSVREFIARGTAKDRKQIVKILKPHVARIAQDDEAQLVMFTALDVIDDTKLTAKQLVAELLPDPPTSTLPADLLKTAAGRRTLLYLLVPRNPRHFPPSLVSTLAATDDLRALTSKKDPTVRTNEVRCAASPALLALVADRGVALSRDPKGSLIVAEIMLFAEGDKLAAQETLLGPLATPYPASDETERHPIDIPHTSRLYKTLLQGGHYDRTTGKVSTPTTFDAGRFATGFVLAAGRTSILAMARGSGTFVIAELCGRLRAEGNKEVRDEVRGWFGENEREDLRSSSVKGRDVLLERLKELDEGK